MHPRDAFPLILLLTDAVALVCIRHSSEGFTHLVVEVAPCLVALPVLLLAYGRMRLTKLAEDSLHYTPACFS